MFNPLIGFSNRADVLQAHLFNQAILERFIYPFHATFCLAAVGTNQFDRQFPESPSELGCAGTSAFRSADPEGVVSENGIYGHSRFCNTDFDDKLACLNLSGV